MYDTPSVININKLTYKELTELIFKGNIRV